MGTGENEAEPPDGFKSMKTVSIITPTLNRRFYLKSTIESVVNQTFKDWEMVIVDDGSTDGTEKMVRECFGADSRIRFLKRKNARSGAGICRNEGFKASSGKYVIFLDSDDLLAPHCLEKRVRSMEEDPSLDFGVFYSNVFFEKPGDTKHVWNEFNEKDDLDRFTGFDIPWGSCSTVWSREAFERNGLWDENLPSWQDVELHVRALTGKSRYKKFPEIDSYYRISSPASIGTQSGSVTHLQARFYFFATVVRKLSAAGELSELRKKNLAKMITVSCALLKSNEKHFAAFRLALLGWRLRLYGKYSFKNFVFGNIDRGKIYFAETFYPFNPEIVKKRNSGRPVLYERRVYKAQLPVERFMVPLLKRKIESLISANPARVSSPRVLDAGCGGQPFRSFLESRDYVYTGIDATQQGNVDIVCQLDQPLPSELANGGFFDLILCTEVLEHVADWETAFKNLVSLLADNGRILITCPFFYRLHEEPYDYWRPTIHALRAFAGKYNLNVVYEDAAGSGWDVTGTLLATYAAVPNGKGWKRKILAAAVETVRRIAFRIIASELLQSRVRLEGPFYLSNIVVFEKKRG